MGLTTLGGLTIENDVMELQSAVVAHREPVRRCFRIDASDNTLRFRSQDAADASSMLLPMDPGIKITMASLQGDSSISTDVLTSRRDRFIVWK
jgi:hypothetical protein